MDNNDAYLQLSKCASGLVVNIGPLFSLTVAYNFPAVYASWDNALRVCFLVFGHMHFQPSLLLRNVRRELNQIVDFSQRYVQTALLSVKLGLVSLSVIIDMKAAAIPKSGDRDSASQTRSGVGTLTALT